jgi:FkbM family methyltransferase
MLIERIEGHSILPHLVRDGGTVIDCGANIGAFSAAMAERFSCRCHAIEPVMANFARIPDDPRIIKHNRAVVGSARELELRLSPDPTRHSIMAESGVDSTTTQGNVMGVTLDQFCRDNALGEIDVLKMDIEGAEFEVIDRADDRLIRRIRQITIEFHRFLGPTSVAEIDRRIARLRSAGFYELRYTLRRNTADVLLVSRSALQFWPYARLHYFVRPWRALLRRGRRMAGPVFATDS